MIQQRPCEYCCRLASLFDERYDGVQEFRCPVGHIVLVAPSRGTAADDTNGVCDELTPWQRLQLQGRR